MSTYRVFQIDKADHIVDAHVVACEDDDEARALAPDFLAGYTAIEIWTGRRRVARVASAPTDGAHSDIAA